MANIATANQEDKQVYVLIVGNTNFEVHTSTNLQNSNSNPPLSSNKPTNQKEIAKGVEKSRKMSSKYSVMFQATSSNKLDIPTLIDSGASNHCFADKTLFTTYIPLNHPSIGLSVGRDSTFRILGKGTIKLRTYVNGEQKTITLDNVIYAPELKSNLISVSKLGSRGASIIFDKTRASIRSADGTEIIFATRFGQLYMINIEDALIYANIAQCSQKPASFATWHHRLGHAGEEVICAMIQSNAVDGLNTYGDLKLEGLCEDCVFGKHTTRPFYTNTARETEVLECIHIDIWGPAQVQSAGGANYFMAIIDSFSSYKTVFFINLKSADTTLKIFKAYQAEVE